MKHGKNASSSMRHRLILQQEIQTPDDIGGYVRSWRDIAELWAEIIPMKGREEWLHGQLQAEVTHKIRLRFRPGIHAGMRLLYGTRALNIRQAINVEEMNDTLELLVEEGVAA